MKLLQTPGRAVAVALRGSPVISDISPKNREGPSVATRTGSTRPAVAANDQRGQGRAQLVAGSA